jgi:hypothetical protein
MLIDESVKDPEDKKYSKYSVRKEKLTLYLATLVTA